MSLTVIPPVQIVIVPVLRPLLRTKYINIIRLPNNLKPALVGRITVCGCFGYPKKFLAPRFWSDSRVRVFEFVFSTLTSSLPPLQRTTLKSGIDEEGQHHKSPEITGPSGLATLLHRIGRKELLERLLDTDGTQDYNLRVITGQKGFSDLYVKRRGVHVEVSNT